MRCSSPRILLASTSYDNALVGRGAVGFSQFLHVCSAAMVFWSGDLFRQTHFVRAFVDVNQFKQINDTLGHEAGDRVLQYVATFLKRHVREAD